MSKINSTKAGVASCLRHVAKMDRVMSHKSRGHRTVEWYNGYMWCLDMIGDRRKDREFCARLLEYVNGLYEVSKTDARAFVKAAS